MSLLTLVQTIAEEVGVSSPSSVSGSADRTAKQLLRLVNRSGKALARKAWPALQKEYTFTTTASIAAYAFPSDYGFILDGTVWDRTNFFQMRGGLDPWEWQIRKSAIATTVTSRKRYRIKPTSGVKQFYIDPTPTAANSLVFEYISNAWVVDGDDGTFKTAFSKDSDTSLIDQELLELAGIWRFLQKKGLPYAEEAAEYERQVDMRFAQDKSPQVLHMGGPEPFDIRMNVPESGFG